VIGEVIDLNLSMALTKPKTQPTGPAATAALNEAQRKARELTKKRLNQAEERAKQAEKRAVAAEARAKRELAAAAASANRKAAEARVTAEAKAKRELAAAVDAAAKKAAAERSTAAQPTTPVTTTPAAPADPASNIQSLQVVEALLGRGQRKVIQRILKTKGFYNGPIDSIFGDLTRTAIRNFQRSSGASETGYLTPNQFQQLVASR
jgi:hypothetical protein